MTDLFIFFVFMMFFFLGLKAPYIAIMGFIWVDTIKPQSLAYGFMNDKPLSMIIAVVCILSFILHKKDAVTHHSKGILSILIIFSIWITITTSFALFPEFAWEKWNTSIKVLVFSVLIPFFISNKSQLEAIMVAFSISMSMYVLAVGVKTALGGGGYGVVLIPGSNGVLGESSTFAAFSVMVIPFYIFFTKHSILFEPIPFKKIMMVYAITLSVLANIGSGARTGLIGIAILFGKLFLESKRKITLLFIAFLVGIIAMNFLSDSWYERMNTLNDVGNEGSAMGRVVVWKWTLDFVSENPMGGGFSSYLANKGQLDLYSDNPNIHFPGVKAFHSIYFEVLGEHGYFGIFLYLLLIFTTLIKLEKIKKETRDEWIKIVATMLKIVIIVFCVCGSFIGIAFQPTLYLMIAYTISLHNLHIKIMQEDTKNEI